MHRKSRIPILLIAMLAIASSLLFAASNQVAAWDRDKLDQPIALDGRIRHQEENSYSFVLNTPGIPEEPVIFEAKLSDSIDSSTGIGASSSAPLFDPEKVRFVTDGFLSYIGAEVSSISPDTTVYTDNGNVYEGEGNNIDLIEGASARLTLKYNPSYTHQKGAIWYCVNDITYGDFAALPGGDSCTILGNETTDLTGNPNSSEGTRPKVIRAVSIYDPWFDAMEETYGDQARAEYREANPDATDAEVAAVTWKTMYLRKTDKEHLESVGIWRYPNEEEVTVYTDYLVTVRSPIEMVTFTAKAEYNALGDVTNQQPQYLLYNDQIAHPDMTATNKIWCYDTSDASAGNGEVDAFRIETSIDPDYGYNLEFEIVQGSAIGTLDFTELDGNTFRFIPKEAVTINGEEKTNYGAVVIKATAEEVNFSKYFTLMYVPSNMKLVKYLTPEEMADGGWKKGIVIDEQTGLVDEAKSGQWDVVTYTDSSTNQPVTQLYGMECLVLYPDEVFNLAMVQYVDNKDGNGKQPYYMTDGVYTTDYNKPIYAEYDGQEVDGVKYQEGDLIGYEQGVVKYAITYSVTKNDDPDAELIPGVIEFEHYGKVEEAYDDVVDGVTDVLQESQSDTGQSYWYTTDSQKIRAVKEGTYYLRYTVAPVEDEGENKGEISMAESTLTGGIYLYVVSPVNQALTFVVSQQNTDSGNRIMLEIPYRISAGNRIGAKDSRGNDMPSHWYLGESRGAIRYTAYKNGSTEYPIYYGSAFGIFEDEDYISTAEDLLNFQAVGANLVGIETVSFGDAFLTIADNETCRPGIPDKAIHTWQGQMAISIADSNAGPSITDVRVTGAYGLSRFPGIDNLRIIDTASSSNKTGEFTAANITYDDNGKKVWDFSSLSLTNYQHANMGETGKDITTFYTPQQLEVLNLDSEAVLALTPANYKGNAEAIGNHLNCAFSWGANTRQNLKQLWIGNNRFSSFTVNGFSSLQAVFADGVLSLTESEKSADFKRYLSVYDCASLEYVQAVDTAFNYLMVQFPETIPNQYLTEEDANAFAHSILRADNSRCLYKVNVSGHLSYLELVNNPSLISVIGSNTFSPTNPDNFTMSSDYLATVSNDDSIGGWVRVVNLGSAQFSADQSMAEYIGIKSKTDAGIAGSFLSSPETNAYSQVLIKGVNINGNPISLDNRTAGSNNIEVLKFNYLYRLFSAGGTSSDIFTTGPYSTPSEFSNKMPELETVEIFALVPDGSSIARDVTGGAETHLTADNGFREGKGGIYSFDLKHAGKSATNVLFHHVPAGASINLSDANMQSVEIIDFKGFLNLYAAPNIDDLHINESSSYSAGRSVVEMSRSGVKDFTGTQTFKGASAKPGILEILLTDENSDGVYESSTDSFMVVATPASFNSDISLSKLSSSNPSVCTVSQGASSSNGYLINVVGKNEGSSTVTIQGSVEGITFTTSVAVTVTKEESNSVELKLTGGKDEQSGGTTVKVLEYTTRDDEPLALEVKAFDETGANISKTFFSDYEPFDPENIWVDDNNQVLTFEEGYAEARTNAIPVVVWSFESTGHDSQEYAEVILDSYAGNRVRIQPLVDDQTFKGYVSYTDSELGVKFETTFIVRVTGGAERRWQLVLDPADDPIVFDQVGVRDVLNVTVYDTQLLTDGDRTQLDPSDLREDIVWTFGKGNEVFSYEVASESLHTHHDRIWVTGQSVGSDVLTASYRNVAKVARNMMVDGVDIGNYEKGRGSFAVYDGGNNRDNAWDMDWALDPGTTSGRNLSIDRFINGTVRFNTSKGSFDFTITSATNNLITFNPNSDPDFRIDLVATNTTSCSGGSGCTNGIPPLGQYSDSISKLESSASNHNHWVVNGRNVFDIQPEMQDLLDSGTVELVSISFTSGGREYNWTNPDTVRTRTAPAQVSRVMYMKTVEPDEIILTPEETRYSQTFIAASSVPEAPKVNVGGEMVKVNMLGRTVADAEAYAEAMSPRLMPMAARSAAARIGDNTVINADVYRIVANNCDSLTDVSISSDNQATADGLILFEANGSQSASVNVSISQSALQEITMVGSHVKNVFLDSSNLKTVDFSNNIIGGGSGYGFDSSSSCTQLSHINVSNNKLGTKNTTINIRGNKITPYADHGGESWDWDANRYYSYQNEWSADGLTYLNLSGNGILYRRYKGDACNGQIFITVRMGSDAGIVAEFQKNGGGPDGTMYYRHDATGSWRGAKGSWSSYTATEIGAELGDVIQFRMDANSSGWKKEHPRILIVYPFGK